MYLDFISEIAKIGDKIKIKCTSGIYAGSIVKLSSEMVAIRDEDGKIIVKADSDIVDGVEIIDASSQSEVTSTSDSTDSNNEDGDEVKLDNIRELCLKNFDLIYRMGQVDNNEVLVSNGCIISSTEKQEKDYVPVLLDNGEVVQMIKWRIAGYSASNCEPGRRIYIDKAPYTAIFEMSYEKVREIFIKALITDRIAVLTSILKYFQNDLRFKSINSAIKRLRSSIKQLKLGNFADNNETTLEEFIKKVISNENPNSVLTDAEIRSRVTQEFGKKFKVKVIRSLREKLGIPDADKRSKGEININNNLTSSLQPTCEINKYFTAYHNGAASSNEYPEIRFLDDVVEPSLLADLQRFTKSSTPIPAITTVTKVGGFYYASFLVRPSSIEQMKKYSDAFKLASKIDVANALDAYIASVDVDAQNNLTNDDTPQDIYSYAKRQRIIHNYKNAESAYLSLINSNYSLDTIVKELASMYQEQGNLEAAIKLMEKYFPQLEDSQKAYNFIAAIYRDANDYPKALEALLKSMELCNNSVQKSKVYYNIALVNIKAGNDSDAIIALREATILNPNFKAAKNLLKKNSKERGKGAEKVLNFKTVELINYDIINNNVNDSLFLTDETTKYLLESKQLKNAGNEDSSEYKSCITRYARSKGLDLIKSGYGTSGRDYIFAASIQDSGNTSLEHEYIILASHFTSQLKSLLPDSEANIKELLANTSPSLNEAVYSSIIQIIASSINRKRIIRTIYEEPIWKEWILNKLGIKDADPSGYINTIMAKSEEEYKTRLNYISLLDLMIRENDIEEIYNLLCNLKKGILIADLDNQYVKEVIDIVENVMQLRSAKTYANGIDIHIAIEKKITALRERISKAPSEIACCRIDPILLKISDIADKHISVITDNKEPIVTISSISDASIQDNNICSVQLQVENLEGRMKVLAGALYLISINDIELDSKRYRQVLSDTLNGGTRQYFQFDFPLFSNDIGENETNILCVGFSYKKEDFSEEFIQQKIQIRITRPQEFVEIPNPYSQFAHANTVEDDSMFKGRTKTINEICENISKGKKCYAIYGQKRSGKSSVLYHIAKKLTQEYNVLAVHFSIGENILGDRDSDDKVLYDLYYLFLKEIENGLKRNDRSVYRELFGRGISWDDIKDNPEAQFRDRLDLIIDALEDRYHFNSNKIVLLIDEFTYLYSFIKQKLITPLFMKKMKALIENDYFTVVVAGHDALPNFYDEFENEFRIFEKYKLNYISEKAARELIEAPVIKSDGSSRYHKDAVNRIVELTACSPFYIQILCDEIVKYANIHRHSIITVVDVDNVLKRLVTNQGSISKGDFDNLISSGDGKLNEELVRCTYEILREIAARTKLREYCPLSDIHIYDNFKDAEIINDLIKRDVVIDDKEHIGEKQIKIKVKLFKEWINYNEN